MEVHGIVPDVIDKVPKLILIILYTAITLKNPASLRIQCLFFRLFMGVDKVFFKEMN